VRRLTTLALALGVALAFSACGGGRTVTITHGPVTPTAVVPGPAGALGTVRIFHADAAVEGGAKGYFVATMTTTAVDAPQTGTEIRLTTMVFSFGDGADQLVLEGTAVYPAQDSTIKTADTVVRPVTGGSGIYAGARGWVESTHLADGSWRHVFHLEK
jgi:hypothetical protein